jgi:hypothetical protein
VVDECSTGQNECSQDAICTDTEDSYICSCPATHLDVSPDPLNKPGRRCLLKQNECTNGKHDCKSTSLKIKL